jgi:hypothetical protein
MAYNRKMTGSDICFACGRKIWGGKKILISCDMKNPRPFHTSCGEKTHSCLSGSWSEYVSPGVQQKGFYDQDKYEPNGEEK